MLAFSRASMASIVMRSRAIWVSAAILISAISRLGLRLDQREFAL